MKDKRLNNFLFHLNTTNAKLKYKYTIKCVLYFIYQFLISPHQIKLRLIDLISVLEVAQDSKDLTH